MTKEELDKRVESIKSIFGITDPNLDRLQNLLGDKFNRDIVKVGEKATFDLHAVFNQSPNQKKRFKNDPIQPITITYRRLDIIFFTWDKHPEFGEEYIMFDSNWTKYLYLKEINILDLFKNKRYLIEKDYDEWYVETRSLVFDNKFTHINYMLEEDIDRPKDV